MESGVSAMEAAAIVALAGTLWTRQEEDPFVPGAGV